MELGEETVEETSSTSSSTTTSTSTTTTESESTSKSSNWKDSIIEQNKECPTKDNKSSSKSVGTLYQKHYEMDKKRISDGYA